MTLWTVARQVPLSMEFTRQEYWSGLPFLSPRDLLYPRLEPESPASPALAGGFVTTESPGNTLPPDPSPILWLKCLWALESGWV